MAVRSVVVRVPASTANLGPGFDSFAAALALHLEVEVSAAERFALTSDLDLPCDRRNLIVRAFERLHSAERFNFKVTSAIPPGAGLGSSAAAIVAGLLAAARLTGGIDDDVYGLACELEGHPDNVAAALYGGVVVCADGVAHRFAAPAGLAVLLVIPENGVKTADARALLPAEVPLADAVYNTAHGALLMLGLATGDLELVARGLQDRLHQPYREHLYPQSAELVRDAPNLGALGATISGAGPTVLVWVASDGCDAVREALERRASGWARVTAADFVDAGATATAFTR
ncbi:MAG: homoserine kinase [Solirubrobacteraceae bacterium]